MSSHHSGTTIKGAQPSISSTFGAPSYHLSCFTKHTGGSAGICRERTANNARGAVLHPDDMFKTGSIMLSNPSTAEYWSWEMGMTGVTAETEFLPPRLHESSYVVATDKAINITKIRAENSVHCIHSQWFVNLSALKDMHHQRSTTVHHITILCSAVCQGMAVPSNSWRPPCDPTKRCGAAMLMLGSLHLYHASGNSGNILKARGARDCWSRVNFCPPESGCWEVIWLSWNCFFLPFPVRMIGWFVWSLYCSRFEWCQHKWQ